MTLFQGVQAPPSRVRLNAEGPVDLAGDDMFDVELRRWSARPWRRQRLARRLVAGARACAFSIACCEVTPTCLRNLRIDMLKSSLISAVLFGVSERLLTQSAGVSYLHGMGNRICLALVWLLMLPLAAAAGERDFRLNAPQALVDSGVLKHLLPRFSLKTQIRIEVVADGGEVALVREGEGVPVFDGAGARWRMRVQAGHPGAERFADWLTSEVGQRTLTSYQVDGAQVFTLPEVEEAEVEAEVYTGDAEAGLKLSSVHCGRCHVVSPANKMNAIGSSPSFYVLRGMGDWDERFRAFFALKPAPVLYPGRGCNRTLPDQPALADRAGRDHAG